MHNFLKLPDTFEGDYAGVHFNSGIPNHAFYVTALNIKGFAWEKAGRIWYEAAIDKKLKTNATFEEFKEITIEKAETLFGAGSAESTAVKDGWAAVKV
jgi:Zn-dependent metalloprotease